MDKWIKGDLERNADGLMGTIEHLEGWENWTETTMPCLAVDDLDVDRDTGTTPGPLTADGMYEDGDDEGGEEQWGHGGAVALGLGGWLLTRDPKDVLGDVRIKTLKTAPVP